MSQGSFTDDDIPPCEAKADRTVVIGLTLLRKWRSDPIEIAQIEISHFIQSDPEFRGLIYPAYLLAIDDFVKNAQSKGSRIGETLRKQYDDWLDNTFDKTMPNDFATIILTEMQPILDAGLFDDWWDTTMAFLSGTFQLMHRKALRHGQDYFTWKLFSKWLQAVESVRMNNHLAFRGSNLGVIHLDQNDFADGVRYGTFLGRSPFWFDHNTDIKYRSKATDIEGHDAKLDGHMRYLLATEDQQDSDVGETILMASEVLKDIRAYPEEIRPEDELQPVNVAMRMLALWMKAKQQSMIQYITAKSEEVQQLCDKDLGLEQTERTIEKTAEIVSLARFLRKVFKEGKAVSRLESDTLESLTEWRERYIPGPRTYLPQGESQAIDAQNEVARLWRLVWKILEKSNGHFKMARQSVKPEQNMIHSSLCRDFLRSELKTFASTQLSEIYTRRLMHLTVGRYCDHVYENDPRLIVGSRRIDSTKSQVSDIVGSLEGWLYQSGSDHVWESALAMEHMYAKFHVVVSQLRELCWKIGVDLSMSPYMQAREIRYEVLKSGIVLDPIPDKYLVSVYAFGLDSSTSTIATSPSSSSSPSFKLSSPIRTNITVSSPISSMDPIASLEIEGAKPTGLKNMVIPQPLTVETVQEIRSMSSMPGKALYTRLIPGSDKYLLPETGALANAHSNRIRRALVESNLDEKTETSDVTCEVKPPFQLPGITEPAGLYPIDEQGKSADKRAVSGYILPRLIVVFIERPRTTWTRARTLFKWFSFGRKSTASICQPIKLTFPAAPEYLTNLNKTHTRCIKYDKHGMFKSPPKSTFEPLAISKTLSGERFAQDLERQLKHNERLREERAKARAISHAREGRIRTYANRSARNGRVTMTARTAYAPYKPLVARR